MNDPLVEFEPTRHVRVATVVDSLHTLDLTPGIFIRPDLELSMNLPLNLVRPEGESAQFGMGDIRFQGKYRVPTEWKNIAFSVIPELWAPSGDRSLFLSNGSWGIGVRAAFEADLGPIRAALNGGYRHFGSSAQYFDIDYENQFPWALGVLWPISPLWGINVEAAGAATAPIDRFNNPSEFYAGARFQVQKDLSLEGGFSTGSLGGGGSGDKRVIVGMKFYPEF